MGNIPRIYGGSWAETGGQRGMLIGHSAIRHYAMGDASQEREATGAELESMRNLLREAMTEGLSGYRSLAIRATSM